MHQAPQQRSMSTYPALLEPVCRRRLPLAPDQDMRRSSSPRILPTPPPLSPEYRCTSASTTMMLAPVTSSSFVQATPPLLNKTTSSSSSSATPPMTANLDRRPSGRLLPRPPPTSELMTHMATSSTTTTPVSLTPDPTPDEEDEYQEEEEEDVDDEYIEEQEQEEEEEEEEAEDEEIFPLNKFTDKTRSADPILAVEKQFQLPPLNQMMAPPVAVQHQRRMSKFSVHSPSIEQITSKSNSDSEDPIVHGLDPSLYAPNAAIIIENNNAPIIHKTSCASTSSPDPQRPTGLGLLHCSLQHFPVRKRLRVSILKIEALAGELKPEMEIHAICKVSIPGLKGGKEQVSEMKRGRDPVYNQEFFFDNVTHEELDTKTVIVSACHQGAGKIVKDIVIGEATVPLRDIREMNTKKEIKIVEEIRALVPKKLGKIYTSSVIEKDAKRLTINLKKVDDLPRCGLTGAPDVCVKITLTQGDRTQTKSSRILKNTTTAVYNEAVMFLFGTTKNELAKTSIVISVHDMQRTCTGDDIIGCAYLGVGAIDKSEIEQWKNTTEHLGKEYKGNHSLKAPIPAPPVHVAEATNDEGVEGDDD